jgi:hypothetical protein
MHLLSEQFFPGLIASPFMDGLRAVFYLSAIMCLAAAAFSWVRVPRQTATDGARDTLAAGAIAAGDSLGDTLSTNSILEEDEPSADSQMVADEPVSGASRR